MSGPISRQVRVQMRPLSRSIVVAVPQRDVVVKDPVTVVIDTGGKQGIQGPEGPPGPAGGSSVVLTAGETIFGLRAVRAAAGIIYRPDLSVIAHSDAVVGVALQSGGAGAQLSVQVSGELSESSWSWSPGAVYCGPDGVLTQTPPDSGWLLSIGRATSATTIIIDIDTAYIRG